MSGYRCVNYYELCRLCTASHGTKTHIFSEEGRRKDLIGKIAVCLPVVIDEHDKLPKILCSQCLNQVESIAKFRETCINAQTMLESCLNSSKLRNGGKVYIKDVTPKKGPGTIANTNNSIATSATLTKTTLTTPATMITSTSSTISTAPPLVKTTYQPKATANVTTTPSDFLSSIIQAVGIQNIDDTPETVVTAPTVQQSTAQTPQYTITLDSKTIKSNQIHYKIEAAKPACVQQEQQPTFSSTYQNSALSQVDEFLKLKTNPQISATIVKRDGAPVKIDPTPPTPTKKQKFNLVITSPPSSQVQHLQHQQPHQQQHQIKQQTLVKQNTITPTANIQKQVSLQDLKLISPNKCYLPITLKDGNNDQQIVAQIDAKNLVLPTAYLQMKIRPQIATVDNQHVVQLTNIPNTLSLTSAQPQIRQQQQQQSTAQQILSTASETKTLFTTSTGQNVTITHQPLVTLSNSSVQTYTQQQQQQTQSSVQQQQQQQQQQAQLAPLPTLSSTAQTSTIDTPAGKVQLTMLQNVPTSNITHALPQKSGITIQRIKTELGLKTTVSNSPTITQSTVAALSTNTTTNSGPRIATTANTNKTSHATLATVVAGAATTTTTTQPTKSEVPTCDVCEKVFKRKEHLAQHVKLHLGLRPFKCEEPNCNKAFSRKEHLMRHVVSHTGKKMFSCEFCQKLFSRKDNLNKHRRTHTDPVASGPYICNICNKSFVVKMYYEQHKTMHKTTNADDDDDDGDSILIKDEDDSEDDVSSTIFNGQNFNLIPALMQQTTSEMSSIHVKSDDSHDTTVMNLPGNFGNIVSLSAVQYHELLMNQQYKDRM